MRKQRAERLRFAVNTLPPETQRAMLDGIKQNRIVTGANTDRRGGLCPMLAADRDAFEVTPLAEIFATAWDHYTGTSFVNVTRRSACERDLGVLRSMLETSLELSAGPANDLVLAASEIRAESPPPPTPVLRPDNAEASRVLTAAARLEIIRALEATGHTPPAAGPAGHVETAAAAPPAPDVTPAPAPSAPVEAVPASRPPGPAWMAARVTRAQTAPPAPVIRGRAQAASAPATRTQTELERQRAREIIANQAATLRQRAWPRPVEPAADAVAARATPVATPVSVPRPQLGDTDRTRELQERSGWAWLRPFSSYEDYEQTLQDLGELQRGPDGGTGRLDDGGHRREDAKRPAPSPA